MEVGERDSRTKLAIELYSQYFNSTCITQILLKKYMIQHEVKVSHLLMYKHLIATRNCCTCDHFATLTLEFLD